MNFKIDWYDLEGELEIESQLETIRVDWSSTGVEMFESRRLYLTVLLDIQTGFGFMFVKSLLRIEIRWVKISIWMGQDLKASN